MLFRKLHDLGIHEHIYGAITSLYDNAKCFVRLNGLKTDYIDVTCGLKQGCILSTLLFNLYVNDLVLRINNLDIGIEIDDEKIAVLLYADDLVLIAASEGDLQILLNELNVWCQNNCIKINQQKSNVVHFRSDSVVQTRFSFKCGTICLDIVSQYIYSLSIYILEYY